jgi:hypothetical protein
MWQKIITNLKKKIIDFSPLSIILYLSLTHVIARSNYTFIKEEPTEVLNTKELPPLEIQYKMRLRKKVLQDLTHHKLKSNWNAHTITKVTINNEGKIVGYKIYTTFYPNYFTKTQITNVLKKTAAVISQNSELHSIKVAFDATETGSPILS